MTQTYRTISDVAKQFECTHRALRFYEQKGLVTPHRQGFERLYSKRDVERVSVIVRVRTAGLSLDDARVLLELKGPKQEQTFLSMLRLRLAALRVDMLLVEDAIVAAEERALGLAA